MHVFYCSKISRHQTFNIDLSCIWANENGLKPCMLSVISNVCLKYAPKWIIVFHNFDDLSRSWPRKVYRATTNSTVQLLWTLNAWEQPSNNRAATLHTGCYITISCSCEPPSWIFTIRSHHKSIENRIIEFLDLKILCVTVEELCSYVILGPSYKYLLCLPSSWIYDSRLISSHNMGISYIKFTDLQNMGVAVRIVHLYGIQAKI